MGDILAWKDVVSEYGLLVAVLIAAVIVLWRRINAENSKHDKSLDRFVDVATHSNDVIAANTTELKSMRDELVGDRRAAREIRAERDRLADENRRLGDELQALRRQRQERPEQHTGARP